LLVALPQLQSPARNMNAIHKANHELSGER
jgi:hypothetical protein